jgi:hypothetical protein
MKKVPKNVSLHKIYICQFFNQINFAYLNFDFFHHKLLKLIIYFIVV